MFSKAKTWASDLDVIGSLHRLVCIPDAREHSGAAPEQPRRERYRLPPTIVADAIAMIAFAVIMIGGMFIAWGLS